MRKGALPCRLAPTPLSRSATRHAVDVHGARNQDNTEPTRNTAPVPNIHQRGSSRIAHAVFPSANPRSRNEMAIRATPAAPSSGRGWSAIFSRTDESHFIRGGQMISARRRGQDIDSNA